MDLPQLASYSIEKYINEGRIPDVPQGLPEYVLKNRSGVFVSIHKNDTSLRGCIGTIYPQCDSIAEEIMRNAISAATLDDRFSPIVLSEIKDLNFSIDLLGKPEIVSSISMLDPKKYGIIVSTADGRQGVLLPDIEGVNSVHEQIKICLQKGGILPKEQITVERFKVERYRQN